ncbi:hypothetical protein HYFRA_00007161 [Hymenoscyphus fraxineus]|uniref:SNF2 N-terminal domain-containing protein n=1 Tax=Hymenoscyphus fraxineus TaxID=746836 RepID=A0A9N9PPX9_9HELO|nr:hypothetical protein HYFRA_00007161 [Hymenoscyphus fraxineus]
MLNVIQVTAVDHIYRKYQRETRGVLLGDQAGLGKTGTMISFIHKCALLRRKETEQWTAQLNQWHHDQNDDGCHPLRRHRPKPVHPAGPPQPFLERV